MAAPKSFAVLGGGLSGLSAAYFLRFVGWHWHAAAASLGVWCGAGVGHCVVCLTFFFFPSLGCVIVVSFVGFFDVPLLCICCAIVVPLLWHCRGVVVALCHRCVIVVVCRPFGVPPPVSLCLPLPPTPSLTCTGNSTQPPLWWCLKRLPGLAAGCGRKPMTGSCLNEAVGASGAHTPAPRDHPPPSPRIHRHHHHHHHHHHVCVCSPSGNGSHALELIEALHLEDEALVADKSAANRFVLLNGKLERLPSSFLSIFSSPLTQGLLPGLVRDLSGALTCAPVVP